MLLLFLLLTLLAAHHLVDGNLLQGIVNLPHVVCLLELVELVEARNRLANLLPVEVASVASASEAEIKVLTVEADPVVNSTRVHFTLVL